MKTYKQIAEALATKIAARRERQMRDFIAKLERISDAVDLFAAVARGASDGVKQSLRMHKRLETRTNELNKRFYLAVLTLNTEEVKAVWSECVQIGVDEALRQVAHNHGLTSTLFTEDHAAN